uniref:AAC-rich mRNA clone AAC4 protein-like n=1 Tax=Saccoglossus kowalevskii TaxID=10224 RepID=A0ABM0MW39_SACKO|nr:PREDICTED: AAC-rich mRNA clone AAC4 protein-like [Saccoglossus kowalevskii]
MEVAYFPYGGSITDYTCQIFNTKLGVSVTRAMKYKGEFDIEDAEKLLNKKLNGVINATKNSLEDWSKQILHIWSTSSHVTNTVIKAYNGLPSTITSNTVVLITTVNKHESIFRNNE